MRRARLAMLGLLSLTGCAGAGAAAATAAVNTAFAVGASAASRAGGGCYAVCTEGTTCNHATGLCDPLPCRGTCAAGEVCEVTGTGERCIAEAAAGVMIEGKAKEKITPR